jgi:hypothetical protein
MNSPSFSFAAMLTETALTALELPAEFLFAVCCLPSAGSPQDYARIRILLF